MSHRAHAGSPADSTLATVLAALKAREPLFHRAGFGTTRSDFAHMIADDFWEVGASGKRYEREFVLDALERRHAAPHDDTWDTSEFECRTLGDDTFLLTYLLRQDRRTTRRATVWQRHAGEWKALYHQGTLVGEGDRT